MYKTLLAFIGWLLFFATICPCHIVAADAPALVGFVENAGQWPRDVLFLARLRGGDFWITKSGTISEEWLRGVNGELASRVRSRELYVDANASYNVRPIGERCSVALFAGSTSETPTIVRVYQEVLIADIYPGVSFRFSTDGDGRVIRRILSQAGSVARAHQIRHIDATGSRTQPLTASMSTVYGAFVGGPGHDVLSGIVRLPNGDVVVGGTTPEITFPNPGSSTYVSHSGGTDVFFATMDAKLSSVTSYAIVGGSSNDVLKAMCTDGEGNIYGAGETYSTDFPTTPAATSRFYKAETDGFIIKINHSFTKLLVGAYHGGNGQDIPSAIAVNEAGQIYVAGQTTSTADLPVTFPPTVRLTAWVPGPPVRYIDRLDPGGGRNEGRKDGFVALLSPAGVLQQSRYFGGEADEGFTALALDRSGSVYLTGSTSSTNFETAPMEIGIVPTGAVPFSATYAGGTSDAFVVKLTSDLQLAKSNTGSYSTFFGGSGRDEGRALLVDNTGRVFVVGVTTSTNLPTKAGAHSSALGAEDIFLAILSNDGRQLVGATYFGGSGKDLPFGAGWWQGSTIMVYGSTESNDFPIHGDGASSMRAGTSDGFLTVLNLSSHSFSSLIGGDGEDTVQAAVQDQAMDVFYSMNTTSREIAQSNYSASSTMTGVNGFVGKHVFGTLALSAPLGGELWCNGSNRLISWSPAGLPDTTRFTVEIQREGSSVWSTIARNVVGRSMPWKVDVADAGRHIIRVSTSRGHVAQSTAPFVVVAPPKITEQPQPLWLCPGERAELVVAASGEELRYQWRRNGVDVVGARSDTLRLASTTPANVGLYTCVVSGACSPAVTSNAVQVALYVATSIETQPVGGAVSVGQPFTLRVVARGEQLRYQWLKNGDTINNATQSVLNITTVERSDEALYACIVQGRCGGDTTEIVRLQVLSTDVAEEIEDGAQWGVRVLSEHPARDEVVVGLDVPQPVRVTMSVLDARGTSVYQAHVDAWPRNTVGTRIPLHDLSAGLYRIVVESRLGAKTLPVVVLR